MDRPAWLKEKRRLTEERMDTLFAPLYDEKWGVYSNASHLKFIQKFLSLLPRHATILDAACGTGKYWRLCSPNQEESDPETATPDYKRKPLARTLRWATPLGTDIYDHASNSGWISAEGEKL